MKQHPVIRKLIQGGERKEYAAHLIPEGGFRSIPALSGNGWCLAGDAAQLVNFVHREGTNLAMKSGELAATAIIEATNQGDFSAQSLGRYDEAMRASFIMKDLKNTRACTSL